MHRSILLTLLPLALPACLDPDDTPELATEVALLTGTANPVDCGFDDGRTCRSTTSLAHGVRDQVQWDPCLGGAFTWQATFELETRYDRACVGGVATAGSSGGCSAGIQLNGSGAYAGSAAGPVTLSLATDGSVSSRGITSLTATCSEPLFLGVYRATPSAAGHVLVTGVREESIDDRIASESLAGNRLSKIEVWRDSAGATRFDGVFTPGAGNYQFRTGMTLAQFRAQMTSSATAGLELSDVEVFQTAAGPTYVGVWRAGTREQVVYDGRVADFWSWNGPYTDSGYRPSVVESYYDSAGVHRYTVVMTRTPGASGWVAAVGVEYAAFIRAWDANRRNGWRLTQLETHVANGVRYYDGFFVRGTDEEHLVPGSRRDRFEDLFAANRTANLELIDLDRHMHARTSTDAARGEMPTQGDYPVVAPGFMAQAETFFQTNWGAAPGYTMAVMANGELLGASSSGLAKFAIDGGVRMTPDAQWDYLSVSKWITTLAAAKLAEEEGIDIRTEQLIPVIAHRLGLEPLGTTNQQDFWHITVWNAMTHTSNLFNGGCDNGPDPANWDMVPGPGMQRAGGRGIYNYSGFDSCFLRLWVEEVSGMPFERYIDTHVFRPLGIHNLDCKKDPEPVEVLQYRSPTDTARGRSEPNTYCAAAGYKGTALQMLKIMQAVRVPGVLLGREMLDEMRIGGTNNGDEWTFYQSGFDVDGNGSRDVWGYSMTGGRVAMNTVVSQFPRNALTSFNAFTTDAYADGLDVVFFTNGSPSNMVSVVPFAAMTSPASR